MRNRFKKYIKSRDVKLLLCDRDKSVIKEITSAIGRHLEIELSGINELSFKVPRTIEILNNQTGEMETVKNKDFEDIKEELLIQLIVTDKNSGLTMRNEHFYINHIENIRSEDSTTHKEIMSITLPYTFQFRHLVEYSDVSSLEEVFNRTIGRKTGWTIDHIDDDIKYSGDSIKRRFFDVTDVNLLDFFFEIIETFDAIPKFDTVRNRVSFYSYENYGQKIPITIDDKNILKSIEMSRGFESVATRMYCYGNDGLNFRKANPLGVDYVEDFSYYMYPFEMDSSGNVIQSSRHGMSDELCKAITLYNKEVQSVEGMFSGYLDDLERAQKRMTELKNGLDDLNTEYIMLEDQLDILNAANADGREVKLEKDRVAQKIRDQQDLIDKHEIELKYIENNIDILKEEIKIENFLSDDLIIEKERFVKEHVWVDQAYIDEFEMFRDAKNKIKVLSQPLITLELAIVDIFSLKEFHSQWQYFELGNVVNVKHDDFGLDIDAKITKITYALDDYDLSIEVSNDKYVIDGMLELADIMNTTTSTSTKVDLGKIRWDKASKTTSDIDKVIDAKWDDIKDKIEVGTNNSVEIGRRGIIIKSPDDPKKYLVANNGVLAITDDGGETWKHAITSEGIVGDRIYGKLGAFAKVRADQIIVGDNGERIPDSVIGSADYWNEMANSVEDNVEVIEDLASSDVITPKDKLVLEREYYQLTNRYINMIKDLDKERYPREYKQLIEEYERIQKVTEPLLKDMDKKSKYNSREFREIYKSYYDIEEEVTRLIAKKLNEQMQEMGKEIKDELEHFVETTVDPLEDYVNGNITMWFAGGKPTMSNYPVDTWDRDEYGDHVGDLYYDELWGDTYKFIKDISSGMFMWEKIGDNNIAKAMYEASQAKDTADGKRRVFVEQPKTPYDEGDLWTQGTNGHLMVCKNSRQTGSFRLSDWERATKYTDDAKAIEAIEKAQDSLDKIYNITDDGVITNDEKPILKREWETIKAKYSENIMLANKYGIRFTNYKQAYGELQKLIEPILENDDEYYSLDRVLFNAAFKDYYIQELAIGEEIYEAIEYNANEYTDKETEKVKKEMEQLGEELESKIKDAEGASKDLESTINKITDDNYITKMESELLNQNLQEVVSTANEIIDIADNMYLRYSTERVNYYNSIFGSNKLKDTLEKYINKFNYPIYVGTTDLDKMKNQFEDVGKTRELLTGRIEKERNRLLKGEIDKDIYEVEQKADAADRTASKAQQTIKQISEDNYITKLESELLKQDLEDVVETATQLIDIADNLGLKYYTDRQNYYNSVFGDEGIKELLSRYINSSYYPIYITSAKLDDISKQFNLIAKYREKLTDRIVNTKDSNVSYELQKDIDRVEKITDGLDDKVQNAKDSADKAQSNFDKIASDNYITKTEAELLKQDLESVIGSATEIIKVADNMQLKYSTERQNYYNSIYGKDKLKDNISYYINKSYYPIYMSMSDLNNMAEQFENVNKTRELLVDKIETERNRILNGEISLELYEIEKTVGSAKNTAEKAESNFNKISNDNYITKLESELLKQDLESVIESATQLMEFADSVGLKYYTERQNYYNSVFGKDGIQELLNPYIDKYTYPIYIGAYNLEQIKKQFGIVEKNREKLSDRIVRERDNILNNNIQIDINRVDGKVQDAKDTADKAQSTVVKISEDKYITKMESELLNQDLSSVVEAANELIAIADSLGMQYYTVRYNYYNSVFGKSGIKELLDEFINKPQYPIYISGSKLSDIEKQFGIVEQNREKLADMIVKERDIKLNSQIQSDISKVDDRVQSAKDTANKAQGTVVKISEDKYITKMESELLNQDLTELIETANELLETADSLGLAFRSERRNYYNAVFGDSGIKQELEKYINKSNYPIYIGDYYINQMNDKFKEVNKTREILSDKIITERDKKVSEVADNKIDALDDKYDGKISNLEKDVDDKVQSAKDTADKAQNNVNNITKDNYITKMESELLRQDLSDIIETANELIEVADSLGLAFRSERRNYYNAVFGSSGIKQELEKYIGKYNYPIYVGSYYIQEIDKKFKEVGKTREILSNKIITEKDKIVSNSADGKIKDVEKELGGKIDDVEKEINENLPSKVEDLIDMNPDLIRSSRKYSEVQITKEEGIVARHSQGEYTQLNGSGLIRYVPHPIFESTPTYKEGYWRRDEGANHDVIDWSSTGCYVLNGKVPYEREGHASFYSSHNNNRVIIDMEKRDIIEVKLYMDDVLIYEWDKDEDSRWEPVEDKGSSRDDWREKRGVHTTVNKGWHNFKWVVWTSPRFRDSEFYITYFRFDDNIHRKKLVGWKNTGYKYGYRTHIGEAVSDSRHPHRPVLIQLPIDFIMDNATYGAGFDVFLAVKSYSGAVNTTPHLELVSKWEDTGVFFVRAYAPVWRAFPGLEDREDAPLHFTYFAVSRR